MYRELGLELRKPTYMWRKTEGTESFRPASSLDVDGKVSTVVLGGRFLVFRLKNNADTSVQKAGVPGLLGLGPLLKDSLSFEAALDCNVAYHSRSEN